MKISFLKMHGLGNDFVVIDDLAKPLTEISPKLAQRICDRRFGVGADQILRLKRSEKADAFMEIINADGSVAEMCGNGIRAVALYLYRRGLSPGRQEYRVDTLAGVKTLTVHPGKSPSEDSVTVDMGIPVLGSGFPSGEPIDVEGEPFKFFEVNVGNPHAVFYVDDVDVFPVEQYGPLVEHHPRFPRRTNVEFVQVIDPSRVRVRVWERGAGITLACGTGATAVGVATLARGMARSPVRIDLPGGALKISWNGIGTPALMEGPAEEVFQGEFIV